MRKSNRQGFMTSDPQQGTRATSFPAEMRFLMGGSFVTEKQLQELRGLLIELLKESMARFEEANLLLRNGSQYNPGDETSDENDRNRLLSRLDQVKQNVGEIHQALNRIRSGTYGECVACKGWISIKRLKILPTARFCLQCQKILEQKDKKET
ncbi:TraR/DksA C4-type zinc finger protein [Desulfonatronospira sp.]|uniref:TraR/DksA family transcriptional regulator n=1 Tax=Desulfonatronospira sp. TaxID=1962951 RepID=UPI0025BDD325|nr:TraR/DksA C4-type zinc finger protein [Desulfonatronospira sp.]